MTRRWISATCIVLAMLFVGTAIAKSHKVLVLPLEGDVDNTMRTRLKASVGRLARQLEGTVAVGDVTFGETAAAVGCDPAKPKCVDEVLDALAVDELVWGTATRSNGKVVIVLHRASKGGKAREVTASISASDEPERAEPGLQPLFSPLIDQGTQSSVETSPGTGSDEAGSASGDAGSASEAAGSGSDAQLAAGSALPPPPPHAPLSRNKKLGIGLAVGGGAALVLGFALWASESSMQTQIDNHDTSSAADIADLRDLEDRANTRAWGGNIMVAAGLALGGYGAYLLWKDHKEHANTVVAPAPAPSGAGVTFVLRGRW